MGQELNPIPGPVPAIGQDPAVLQQLAEGVAQAQQPQALDQPPDQGTPSRGEMMQQPAQPPPRVPGTSSLGSYQGTKGQIFRNMLGDFLYATSKGLEQAGHGPGANARGAGVAGTALYERGIEQQQMAMRDQAVQNQAAQIEALSQLRQSQAGALNTKNQLTQVPIFGPDGKPMIQDGQLVTRPMTEEQAAAYWKSLSTQGAKNLGSATTTGMNTKSKENIAANKPVKTPSDPLWQITKQTNPGLDTNSPEFAQKWEELRMKEKTEPGVKRMSILLQRSFHPFNDAQGNTIGWVNPVTRQVTMGEDIPGLQQTLAASGGVIPPKPPGQVVGMAVAAGTMLQHMPDIYKEIDSAKNKLGPAAGRWNEYMTGKVGASDPQFTKLRTDIALLQTRLMQAHVGLAGSDKMMEHFANLISQGYQSPENMKAAAETIESYLNTYRGMSPQATGGGQSKITGPLTEAEARQYLQQAGGDANKARSLAKKDGRTF